MSELRTYTIYERPLDFPEKFVVRGFTIRADSAEPDARVQVADTLEEARALIPYGCVCLARDPDDEPQIVETWL